jgi:hypothetical protein
MGKIPMTGCGLKMVKVKPRLESRYGIRSRYPMDADAIGQRIVERGKNHENPEKLRK